MTLYRTGDINAMGYVSGGDGEPLYPVAAEYLEAAVKSGALVPVEPSSVYVRPPQGDCTICGERNLTNNCFESLDGDAWCYKEGRVGEGTE